MKRPPSRFHAGIVCFLCLCLCLPTVLLTLSGCQDSATALQNCITSVTLTAKKGVDKTESTITVYASLTDDFLGEYGGQVYLFELTAESGTRADLNRLQPLASAKARRTVQFRFDLYDGVRTRLFSSFVLASYDKATDSYTALTTPAAISNPEVLADAAVPDTAQVSIKGLISESPSDAIRLGAAYTLVDVPMEKLILSEWAADAVSYLWDGVTCYLQRDALEALDRTVGAYTAAGVRVYLRFSLGWNSTGRAPTALYYPGAVAGADGYAVCMDDPTAARIMEGFFDFMASRYAGDPEGPGRGLCSAFLIGQAVNGSGMYAASGSMAISDHVTNYEKLVRLAHTALVSHCADGRVFLSLNSDLSGRAAGDGWGLLNYLSAYRGEAALRGDYDWQVACELYADSPTVWEPEGDTDSDHLTVHSLSTLTDLLSGEKYLTADGSPRALVISRCRIPSADGSGQVDEVSQATSYAFTYTTALANGRVEALIYDAFTLPEDTSGAGLCAALPTGQAGVVSLIRREIYSVFASVDTTGADVMIPVIRQQVGAAYEKLEEALLGTPSPVRLQNGSASLLSSSRKSAVTLLSFAGGDTCGFENVGHLTYLELTAGADTHDPFLHVRFDRTAVGSPMGIATVLDGSSLIGGKELLLELCPRSLTGDAPVSVTVRLVRRSQGLVAKGQGTVLYQATVSDTDPTSWQTVCCDISSFTSLLDADDQVELSVWLDAGEGTACELGLRSVQVTGVTSSSTAATAILIVTGVIVLAVVAAVVILALRRRRAHEPA